MHGKGGMLVAALPCAGNIKTSVMFLTCLPLEHLERKLLVCHDSRLSRIWLLQSSAEPDE